MPLEFPCPNCQHLLRTADDKAGLSATCPACGESIWVPYPHQLSGQAKEPPADFEDPSSGDEYELDGDDSFPAESPATPDVDADNPFAGESSRQDPPDAETYSLAPSPAGTSENSGTLTCDHCGTENEPDAEQCRACAADLQPPPTPPPRRSAAEPRDPDVGEILQSAWKIFVEDLGLLVGAFLLLFLISIGLELVCMIPAGIGAAIAFAVDDDLVFIGLAAGMVVSLPLWIAASATLHIGYVQLNLNVARGLPAGVGDLFYGFGEGRSQIIPLFLLSLVAGVFSVCTCCLGGLVVWPAGFLVVHRRTDTGEGFSLAIEQIQKEFVTVLLIGLILAGVYVMISILNMCYVGYFVLIFAGPFVMMMMTVGYLRMERERIAVDRD